jgi:hypothetical protein
MVETLIKDNLLAGDFPMITEELMILTGNNLKRGTVLGKITASGKYVAVDSTKSDGSQTPVAVLSEDTDATAGDKQSCAYLTGEFNAGALIFGGTDVIATHKTVLRSLSIFAKNVLA